VGPGRTITKEDLEELVTAEEVTERVVADAIRAYEAKEQELGTDPQSGAVVLRELERMVLLSLLDNQWREHLYEMDYLQEGIGLRAYGQRDPLVEYQREAFAAFEDLSKNIREEFVRYIYRVELIRQDEPQRPRPQRVVMSRGDDGGGQSGGQAQGGQGADKKTPRNAPCWCGSGKKYKKCHGLTA
jgi:preprotein translocase subunit SecA